MMRSAHLTVFKNLPLHAALVFVALAPAFAGSEGTPPQSARRSIESFDSLLHEASATTEARIAKEQYEKKGAEIALRVDDAAASSQDNAAFLYYQALLARREVDPCTVEPFFAVLRGAEPDARVRVYLGQCLKTLELVQIASQMPRCDWGPSSIGGQRLDVNLAARLRQLCFLLNVDARTLAADGRGRAALSRCLTMRRLAHHTGDDTYVLYAISQGIGTMGLRTIEHVLRTMPQDGGTLRWLKRQLAAVPGTPFEPAQAMQKWRDDELQSWRRLPKGRPFTRELVLEKVKDDAGRRKIMALTDDQLLVAALHAEGLRPGFYGISVPPELLDRAREACDKFLASAVQIMTADLPYQEKQTKLQQMVDSLAGRVSEADPIALVSHTASTVAVYHRLMVLTSVHFNLVTAAVEICLTKAITEQLPQALPDGLPPDPFTGRALGYERTKEGFVLRFDPDNLSGIRERRFEFKVHDVGRQDP